MLGDNLHEMSNCILIWGKLSPADVTLKVQKVMKYFFFI